MVGGKREGAHVELDVVLEEVFCEISHLLGPCGGPHEGLSVRLQNKMS